MSQGSLGVFRGPQRLTQNESGLARRFAGPAAACLKMSQGSLGVSRGPQGLTQISQGSLGVFRGPQRPDSK